MFITHNIGVVEYIADHVAVMQAGRSADHVAVMQAGRIVEQGPAEEVLQHSRHDYTRTLLAAAPRVAIAS